MELSDAELARKCRQGDRDAWRLFVRRASPLVHRITVRILGRGAEADDAGQEVMMRLYRSIGSYDPTRPMAPWIARVSYNAALQQLQKRGRPGAAGDPAALEGLHDGAVSSEQRLGDAQVGAIVRAALERLSPEDRVLVGLSYEDGFSNSEVAEATGMPVGTVKTRLFRARERLRGVLGPLLGRPT